jgi:hypothetical protein
MKRSTKHEFCNKRIYQISAFSIIHRTLSPGIFRPLKKTKNNKSIKRSKSNQIDRLLHDRKRGTEKTMSNKEKPSKKAVKKKQEKAIEDSTFGIKNKNKSKKVQQFINRVEKSVKNSNGGAEATKAKDLKKETKLAKQLQEEEMRQLFNEAIGNQYGVKKSKAQSNAQQLGLTTAKKEVTEFLETLSSDSESETDSDDDRQKQYEIEIDDQPVNAIEVFREKTIEDIIEEQRAKLSAEGKKGTPITAESFAKWRIEKLARKQAEAEARLKSEQSKKKGGKGLSVLSGKELFSYNASLFIDDESAFDTSNDKTMNDEIKALQKLEEEKLSEETTRAQAEQMRLFELQQLELQARKERETLKREKALFKNHPVFRFCGVIVNQLVFQEEEDEDLELFADLPLPVSKRQKRQEEERASATTEEVVREGVKKMEIDKSREEEEDNNNDNNNNNGNEEEDDEDNEDNEEEEEEEEEEGEGDGNEDDR